MAQIDSTDLDDLGNLFEFGDIDLNNIPSVDSAQYDDHMQQAATHPGTPFDEISEPQPLPETNAQDFAGVGQYGMSQSTEHGHQNHQYAGQAQTHHPYTSEPTYTPSMHPALYPDQQFQFPNVQGFPSNQHVPPTPNSFDMHGEAGRFMQQQLDPQQRALLEQRYQLRKEDAIAFTPMVSPAGTPQYSVPPEFTIPGAYFSPLTSPMLHAQNGQIQQQQHRLGYYTTPSTAPSSIIHSPLDASADTDMLGEEISLSEPAAAQVRKSSRRKAATPRSAGPLARVKQSPIQKAVKRKSGTVSSSLASTKDLDATADAPRSATSQPPSAGVQMAPRDTSENGSISPEPLSESLMRPPPRPASSAQSPNVVAKQKQKSQNPTRPAATPKSLLSMKDGPESGSKQRTLQDTSGDNDQGTEFEDLQLPAAAAPVEQSLRPSLPQIDTGTQPLSTEDTPRLTARKTPKLGPSSTPVSARPSSSMASPSVVGSPITASTPGALLKDKKSDVKGARANKKRSSINGSGSALVSPALRPRISPSIKPLLPEGATLHSPTHALLLASKSNYQNLLEGNHLPGVNYPDSLSTGLTSKRTSHKVAEQGRRNRINEALKEMQSLLPKSSVKGAKDNSNSEESPEAQPDGDAKDNKDDSVKSNSSKAATVESANEYIRKLQMENAALLQVKKEHEDMKRKLEGQGHDASPPEDKKSPGVATERKAPASPTTIITE